MFLTWLFLAHFTTIMLSSHPKSRLHQKSETIQSCIYFSKIVEEQLMGHILTYLSLMMQFHNIEIIKGAFHRMFLQHVHLTFSFPMFFLVGKVVLLMVVYLTMHVRSHLLFHLAHTCWQMLGFQLVIHL